MSVDAVSTQDEESRRIRAYGGSSQLEGEGATDLIDIIVPVYQGYREVRACLSSVLSSDNLFQGSIIVIDDCSPDAEIKRYLSNMAAESEIVLLENRDNLGFVASCNRGTKVNPERDFILLNADTEVHGNWLDRMVTHARLKERIATITPFSNNATIASYPKGGLSRIRDEDIPLRKIDTAMARANSEVSIELPTAVGFCMYVSRVAWEEVGGFDTVYGRGYGEEVDFCCATSLLSWRHLLACDVFVYHAGAISFGNESEELKAAAQTIIDKRYPNFPTQVDTWVKSDPAFIARARCDVARIEHSLGPRILHIAHNLGGGVQQYIGEVAHLAHENQEAVSFLLQPWGEDGIIISAIGGGSDLSVKLAKPSAEEVTVELSALLGIQRVHFHHCAGLPLWVLALPRRLRLPLDVTVHDFLSICPHFHYPHSCPFCAAGEPTEWGVSLEEWRISFGEFLSYAQRVICPSQFVSVVIKEFYADAKVEVLAHPETLVQDFRMHLSKTASRRKVAVVGGLSAEKGFDLVKATIECAEARDLPLDFVIIGYTASSFPPELSSRVLVTGSYEKYQLPEIIVRERPDCFLFTSQVPETYSYTLSAALATGLPIVAISMGAIAERLANIEHATCLPADIHVNALLEALLAQPQTYQLLEKSKGFLTPDFPEPRAYIKEYLKPLAADSSIHIDAPRLIGRLAELAGEEPLPSAPPPITTLVIDAADRRIESARAELGRQVILMERGIKQRDEHLNVRAKEIHHLESVIQDLKAAHLKEEKHLKSQIQGLDLARKSEVAHLKSQIEGLNLARESELTHLHGVVDSLQASIAAQLASHQEELEVISADRSVLAARVEEIETSTLWRLMDPLRAVLHQIKQLARLLRNTEGVTRRVLIFSRYHFKLNGLSGLAIALRRRIRPAASRFKGRQIASGHKINSLPKLPSGRVVFETADLPSLSIVVPTYGEHDITARCLRSIKAYPPSVSFEVIVIDDAFEQPFTPSDFDIHGIRLIRNHENLGFLKSSNLAMQSVRGQKSLLLNNDTIVLPGAVDALWRTFDRFSEVGAVGSKLLYPDGLLQEAGGIIWRDGSGWNWGRYEDPNDPRFNYVRAVDYCSAAALMVDCAVWRELGGFDERFAPCYYEDTDLCFSIRNCGKHVLYQPAAEVIHFEGISHGTDLESGQKIYQNQNQITFMEKWAGALLAHAENGVEPRTECDRYSSARILWIEACMLTPDQDSGSLRTFRLLKILVQLGCKVTFAADNLQQQEPYCKNLQAEGIEVLHVPHVTSVREYLRQQGGSYDVVTLCRHYVAIQYVDELREFHPNTCIWFDTIDLHYLRLRRQYELDQETATREMAELAYGEELAVIKKADLTIVVSDLEVQELIQTSPEAKVTIVSNIHEIEANNVQFEGRSGIVFVGGFQHPPNIDAVEYYAEEIWPIFREQFPQVETYIIGSRMPEKLKKFGESKGLTMLGFVEDLVPYYERCLLAIAPLRYGAGVKGKVNQALSFGVPVVGSPIALEGMDLLHRKDVMEASEPKYFAEAMIEVYRDPELWMTLSTHGIASLEERFSPKVAESALNAALSDFLGDWDSKAVV